jgi:TP901 family phage tail tape measure protein
MALNMNNVLRITAKVTGLQTFSKLDRAIKKSEKGARKAEQAFKKMLDSRLFRTAAAAATAFGAAIGISTKAAIDFESSMADVRKVVDGLETPEAFRQISDEIMGLAAQMPIAAEGFAEIYAAAGQAGIAREDLKEFATQVAQVAVAFDMTAQEAGTAMAKIKTSLGLSIPALGDLTDAMNHLSNNTASTASELVDFTLRAGQAGKSAGLTAEQTAAFGAAMIASGVRTEIAATSFRNMVKALSRGPSMTERQISALSRLGFAQSDAAVNEKAYTDAVRAESQARIDVARAETNQLAKELNRRFRDQLRATEDAFNDENDLIIEQTQERADAQIKGIRREQQARIEAARERELQTGRSAKREIQQIEDFYEQRIDTVQDALRDDLKAIRRSARDQLQAMRDSLDDRKELELAGLESNFKEIQDKEKALMEQRIAEIKKQAEEGATAAAKALAKGLQEDAIGTITNVFNRIRELPKEAQLSVVSDLFGDEAKGLLPLINNMENLSNSIGLVGDKSNYAGSRLAEYLVRQATLQNDLKEARNLINNLAIAFGQEFTLALGGLIKALTPVINAFTWMLKNIPGFGPVLAVVTGAFVALVAVLPAVASLLVIGPKIAAAFVAIKAAVVGLVAAFTGGGGLLAGIAAVFSGPVGWVALLVAAGVALYSFRDQIATVFEAIGIVIKYAWELFKSVYVDPIINAGKMIYQFFQENWGAISEFVGGVFTKLRDFFNNNFIQPVVGFLKGIYETFSQTFNRIGEAIKAPFVAAFNFLKGIVNNILQNIGNAINGVVSQINKVIGFANSAAAKVGLPQLPYVPQVNIPRFAEGGVVTGPTLAMVGEGGEAEYIVPASKAGAFAANWMAGVRGPAAVPRFAEGGMVAPASANVSIQTGPVTQMNGTNFVTTSDLSAAVQAGVNQTLDLIRRDGNTRAALGLS